MGITFNCTCGKILAAQTEDAGVKGQCPGCGKIWIIPASGSVRGESTPIKKEGIDATAVEDWLFAQQRRLWLTAGAVALVAVGIVIGVFLRGLFAPPARALKPPATGEPAALEASSWRSDFSELADAIKSSLKEGVGVEYLNGKFADHTVRWTVTFEALRGDLALEFKEAATLADTKPPVEIRAFLLPSEGQKAEVLVPGDRVTIRGRIASVLNATTPKAPHRKIIFGFTDCVIETENPPPAP